MPIKAEFDLLKRRSAVCLRSGRRKSSGLCAMIEVKLTATEEEMTVLRRTF